MDGIKKMRLHEGRIPAPVSDTRYTHLPGGSFSFCFGDVFDDSVILQ